MAEPSIARGPVEVGRELVIDIVALDPSGAGVGNYRDDRRTWRIAVPAILPGERARIEVVYASRRVPRAVGRLRALETPHPGRTPPRCTHHPAQLGHCGGCPLMIVDVAAQRAIKRELIEHHYGLALDRVVGGEELGYRMSSKRVVGGRRGAIRLGSYRRGTHILADMQTCLVDHPLIVESFEELRRYADALGIVPFDERTGAGDLRYVWAKCDGSRILLTLVTASTDSLAATALPGQVVGPAGIAWSVRTEAGNAIRGDRPRRLRGLEQLGIEMAGVQVEVGPLGFLQPNPAIAARAYEDLLCDPEGQPASGRLAFDLYAGAGVVTHRLRDQFEQVHACESYPESAESLGIEALDAATFLSRWDRHLGSPELVVANPPRAGMGEQVCKSLCQLGAAGLTIMSCSPGSLARDLQNLSSTYELVRVRGYDTLPQTTHLELVAWLRRRPDLAS